MRAVLLFFIVINFAFCFEVPVDCTQIFEARKEEISKELEIIDEQRQALEVFRASSAAAYEENNKKLAKKEADLNATMKVIEQKRKEIDEVVAKNEKILKELRTMTTDKVNESYAKMKDGAAAEVLSQMPRSNAATILYALDAKKISTIMVKMDPKVASEITALLQKGPPFVDEKGNMPAPAGSINMQ